MLATTKNPWKYIQYFANAGGRKKKGHKVLYIRFLYFTLESQQILYNWKKRGKKERSYLMENGVTGRSERQLGNWLGLNIWAVLEGHLSGRMLMQDVRREEIVFTGMWESGADSRSMLCEQRLFNLFFCCLCPTAAPCNVLFTRPTLSISRCDSSYISCFSQAHLGSKCLRSSSFLWMFLLQED